ncbi:MAG TPA: hypothetical protein DC054_00420 [Blastocatellia bacterium]|nr:hypothetical protein [Blastocatellia bacterium]
MIVVAVTGFGSIVGPVCGQSVPTPGTRGRNDPVQRDLQRRFESEAIESALPARPRRLRHPYSSIPIADHTTNNSSTIA